MAMSVTYTNFAGELVLENRAGVVSAYVPDTQGSTAELWSSEGVVTDEWTYWPFGEVRTRTGTTATPFAFCGTLGYYLDSLGILTYVRARSLRQPLARWQTQDPLWPLVPSYDYASNQPVSLQDPSGMIPNCNDYVQELADNFLCPGMAAFFCQYCDSKFCNCLGTFNANIKGFAVISAKCIYPSPCILNISMSKCAVAQDLSPAPRKCDDKHVCSSVGISPCAKTWTSFAWLGAFPLEIQGPLGPCTITLSKIMFSGNLNYQYTMSECQGF